MAKIGWALFTRSGMLRFIFCDYHHCLSRQYPFCFSLRPLGPTGPHLPGLLKRISNQKLVGMVEEWGSIPALEEMGSIMVIMLRRLRWTLAFGRTTLRAGDWRTAGFSHPFNPTSSVPPELNQAGNDLYAIGFYHSCTLGTRPWHLVALQKIKPSIKDQMQSNQSLSHFIIS